MPNTTDALQPESPAGAGAPRGFNHIEAKLLELIARRRRISKNINEAIEEKSTLGDRLADAVAAFGGSWRFIILFALVLTAWTLANSLLLPKGEVFDPYPFVFLNLILSMVAAIQAPVIMMSQNRQSARDRMAATHDYEINLKSELEIMALHEKIDDLRMARIGEILKAQQEEIEMIRALLVKRQSDPDAT